MFPVKSMDESIVGPSSKTIVYSILRWSPKNSTLKNGRDSIRKWAAILTDTVLDKECRCGYITDMLVINEV